MNSSHSFPQTPDNPALAVAPPRQIARSVYPPESSSVRRTRKELFVDSNRAAAAAAASSSSRSPTRDHYVNGYYHHSIPSPTPSNDAVTSPSHYTHLHHHHPSFPIGAGADTHEEPGPIDPMDVWRTYTKRSIDDRQGRAPLSCIWKIGSSEEGFTECGYGATPKLMRRHVQTTHMHIKRYRCDICDQAFSQGALLHSHKASKHAQIRPYKCPFEGCDKAYVDCPTLLRHKKINHNYIPKSITRYR